MQVSVVIPAYNAEDTIADTLQSLVDQTFPHWEAIVVDDGSTDATPAIVARFVERDNRFRLLRQQNKGESGARNSGIKLARFDWLLFLDADDWILPRHLECLTQVLETDPALDAAYCGWTYVTPDGKYIFEAFGEETGDLFAEHASYCFSIVHTYLVRRLLVEEAGGFHLSLRTCADWDLWQRIARTGAQFGATSEVLAIYRIRAGSATRNGSQLLADGLRVINQGHTSDPRVLRPHPLHVNGESPDDLSQRKFELACACAGYLIGGGKDARSLLDLLKDEQCPHLDVYAMASCLFRHTLISASRPLSEWATIWPNFSRQLNDFLVALEMSSGTPDLAKRAWPILNHLIRVYAPQPESIKMSHNSAVSVIVIFLNAEKFLAEAVDSVLSQTYKDWELLLVDDGSTDGSTEIALKYAEQHPDRIRYLEHDYHQNRGMSASRNLGIKYAGGRYIAFLDADDVWLSQKLEQQVGILDSYSEAAMLYGRTQIWYSWTGKAEDSSRDHFLDLGVQPNTLVEPPALFTLFLKGGNIQTPTTCNVLIRRDIIEEIGGFQDTFRGMFEDQVFFAKLCLKAPVFVADKYWARYRQHATSCCAVAERTGEADPAWESYLTWIATYLTEQKIDDPEVWRVLRRQMWPYHHPTLHRLSNWMWQMIWAVQWKSGQLASQLLPAPVYSRIVSLVRGVKENPAQL